MIPAAKLALVLAGSLLVGAGVGAGVGAVATAVQPAAADDVRETDALGPVAGGSSSDSGSAVVNDPDDPNTWIIDFTGIGPIRMDMTRDQLEALRSGVDFEDSAGGYCGYYDWPDQPAPWGTFIGLVESQGSYGPIDTVEFWDDSVDGLPRTESGIGLGSTEREVLAAYPSAVVSQHAYLEFGHYVDVYGPGDATAMRFDTDNGVVVALAVGRVPQVFYIEGCA